MSQPTPATVRFRDLQLREPLINALEAIGYETPTPIQQQAIPHILDGRDMLGHAPTGTGKTGAFALPLLSSIDVQSNATQVLTLTPTRELAIQVAEAYQRYASQMKGFHVLPVYGGQEYGGQIRQLKRGVQVVVGTPGRLRDHMSKGTLRLDQLRAVVLDEADEMLRMGFVDEVEWILEQAPSERQTILFSATMPKQVERIARRFLKNPAECSIKARTTTAETIRQRYWQVSGLHKLDALTRILEVESFDAILIFVRTKTATTELAERLEARGYAAAAMNGDMAQKQREQMVSRLKRGGLDILVATDVAARGLDVDRISHVINYDVPYDTEAYVHRIGRTGRAGRQGDAILFVSPRERRMLAAIERATRQKIERLELPSVAAVNNKRIADFKQRITDTLGAGELDFMQSLIEQYREEHDVSGVEIAAALAQMAIGEQAMLLPAQADRGHGSMKPVRDVEAGAKRYRIEVGHSHGVKPGNIVGAIANEAGLRGEHIGHIEIDEHHSLVDLPAGMPKEIFEGLKQVVVCGQKLAISLVGDGGVTRSRKQKARANTKRNDRRKPGGVGKAKGKDAPRGKPKGKKPKPKKPKKPKKPQAGKPRRPKA
ncbi:MAG: DEAD/DEAH box helicase [Pseudomonadota bacterium]